MRPCHPPTFTPAVVERTAAGSVVRQDGDGAQERGRCQPDSWTALKSYTWFFLGATWCPWRKGNKKQLNKFLPLRMQSRFGAVNTAASCTWQKPFTLCFGGSRRWLGLLLPEIPANPIEIKASSTWRVSNLKGPDEETRCRALQHALGSPSLRQPRPSLWQPKPSLGQPRGLLRLNRAGRVAGLQRGWAKGCRALCL